MKVAVVGAGAAGCLVTRRLRAAGVEVELIEAGPSSISGGSASLDWLDVQAEPDRRWPDLRVTKADGLEPEPYLTGRGLGGGSSINGMVATLGPLDAYAEWPAVNADIEAAIERVRLVAPTTTVDPGPFGASVLGSPNSTGFSLAPAPLLAAHGQRSLSLIDGIEPTLRATASRLIVDGQRAVGVECDVKGSTQLVEADHTILCGGAIQTPALLLRSGVDNGEVGRGLADHPSRVITIELAADRQLPLGTIAPPITTIGRRDGIELLFMDHTGSDREGRQTAACLVVLMRPESTGSVSLGRSGEDEDEDETDATQRSGELDVHFRLLGDGDDQARLDGATGEAATWLSEIDGVDSASIQPGFGPVSHAAASCRLGTCLDPSGAVAGWEGISVMDSAALPGLPEAHPMLPTLVVTEVISAEWLRRHRVGNHRRS